MSEPSVTPCQRRRCCVVFPAMQFSGATLSVRGVALLVASTSFLSLPITSALVVHETLPGPFSPDLPSSWRLISFAVAAMFASAIALFLGVSRSNLAAGVPFLAALPAAWVGVISCSTCRRASPRKHRCLEPAESLRGWVRPAGARCSAFSCSVAPCLPPQRASASPAPWAPRTIGSATPSTPGSRRWSVSSPGPRPTAWRCSPTPSVHSLRSSRAR